MCQYSKVNTALPSLAGLFVCAGSSTTDPAGKEVTSWGAGEPSSIGRGAPLIMNNKKILGVYIAGNEAECNKGPSYFADIAGVSSTFLSYLRDGTETNSSTVKIEPCLNDRTLSGTLSQNRIYTADNSIVSTQSISDGFSVRYEAGSYIELNNGFLSGTDFIAEIKSCQDEVTIIAAKTDDVNQRWWSEIAEQSVLQTRSDNWLLKSFPTFLRGADNVSIISAKNLLDLDIRVFDINGKVCFEVNVSELTVNIPKSISLPTLPVGVYLLNISNSEILFNQKIVIR